MALASSLQRLGQNPGLGAWDWGLERSFSTFPSPQPPAPSPQLSEEKVMRKAFLITFLMAITTGVTLAQTPLPPAKEYRAQGYGFVGPAAFTDDSDNLITYGVGGEGLLVGGFGVGAELAGFARRGRVDNGFGTLSANASYHFLESRKLDPFATGGFSLFFPGTPNAGINVGGGVNYWFKERVGLRVEVRDHYLFHADGGINVVSVRFGVAFR